MCTPSLHAAASRRRFTPSLRQGADRFSHEGDTIVPGAGVRWKHVHRASSAQPGAEARRGPPSARVLAPPHTAPLRSRRTATTRPPRRGSARWRRRRRTTRRSCLGRRGELETREPTPSPRLPRRLPRRRPRRLAYTALGQVIAVLDRDILRQLIGGAKYHAQKVAEVCHMRKARQGQATYRAASARSQLRRKSEGHRHPSLPGCGGSRSGRAPRAHLPRGRLRRRRHPAPPGPHPGAGREAVEGGGRRRPRRASKPPPPSTTAPPAQASGSTGSRRREERQSTRQLPY